MPSNNDNEKSEELAAGSELSAGLGAATTHGGNFAALTGSPYTAELAWKLKAAESRISGLEDKLRLIGDFAHAGIRFAPMTPNVPKSADQEPATGSAALIG